MIKNDLWIEEFSLKGGITPFNPEQVNPASYDVTLGNHWIVPGTQWDKWLIDGVLDASKITDVKVHVGTGSFSSMCEFSSESLILYPGDVTLATTNEYVKMPIDVACDLKLKSTIGRQFIQHALAGWVDPGFSGNITLELQNIGPTSFQLKAGMRIAQLIFLQLEEPPRTVYNGKYQGQRGATPPRTI